jgi:hypothetical protein
MISDAISAQRSLDAEIDAEAARIIRDNGIPLFEALQIAKRNVRRRRTEKRNREFQRDFYSSFTKEN